MIHNVIGKLEKIKDVVTITQNIDCLHTKGNDNSVLEFHGNLYDLYCTKCHEKVSYEEYLKDYQF